MIDKLYDINKQLDSLKDNLEDYAKDISYYCELREGHCNGCPFYKSFNIAGYIIYNKCRLNNKPKNW